MQIIRKLHTKMGGKYTECNRKKILQMILMNYTSNIYIIYRSAGCTLRQNWFYRDIASRCEYLNSSAFSNMYRFSTLFLVCFMPKCSVLCFSWLFQRVLSCKCAILCSFAQISDKSMLSKCDDLITYATDPLNIQMRKIRYLQKISALRHFL